MKEIFNWGAMGPYDKNDYTKKKAELSNKIRKMHRNFISESRDNFRDPNVPRTGKNGDESVKFEDKKHPTASNQGSKKQESESAKVDTKIASINDKRNRIRKADIPFVSENHDNYRKPKPMNEDELLVLDVFDAQRDGSPSPSASVRAA